MQNPTFSITIDDIAFGGKGVGRLPDGIACFVPDVAPGERVIVEITRRSKRFAEGRVVQFTERSAQRVEPPCPYFGRCGGCVYQHLPYDLQLEIKRSQVAQILQRLGGVEAPLVQPTVASPKELGFRNRITVHVQRGRVGFFERGANRLVEVERCLLASEPVNQYLSEWRKRRPDDGVMTIREDPDRKGFHQTNDTLAALLLDAVAKVHEAGGECLVDAYCGAGFFAHRLAPLFREVIGIEWNPDAVALARENAEENETYIVGDVAGNLDDALTDRNPESTFVILDPPAQGLDTAVCDTLLRHRPAQIVIVSCDPGTLARDIKRLGAGFRLDWAKPFDMFPQTAEIEVLAVLRRA